jgi:arylsulfatase A-like enzyme
MKNTWTYRILLALLIYASQLLAKEKPNVLFIAIDDLNDWISPLDHHPGILTPNLERLAARSMTFTRANCAAPACHPSRVAVMTGVHPVRSGIYRNLFNAHGPRWRDESPLLADAVVLSRHFMNHGYRAAGGGKIFHTLQWSARGVLCSEGNRRRLKPVAAAAAGASQHDQGRVSADKAQGIG